MPKNDFTGKIRDYDTFRKKLPKNVGDLGKLIAQSGHTGWDIKRCSCISAISQCRSNIFNRLPFSAWH